MSRFLLSAFIIILSAGPSLAQNLSSEPAMADDLRQSGKIYVVVGVISIIFIGILVYVISMDSRLNRLEKQLKDKEDKK